MKEGTPSLGVSNQNLFLSYRKDVIPSLQLLEQDRTEIFTSNLDFPKSFMKKKKSTVSNRKFNTETELMFV